MRKIALTAILVLTTSLSATAEDDKDAVTVIHAGQMIDVESGKLLKNQFIIIDGNRIRDVVTLSDMEDMEDEEVNFCLLYTSPSPRDATLSRMPSSA